MFFMTSKLAAIGPANKGQRGTASFRTLRPPCDRSVSKRDCPRSRVAQDITVADQRSFLMTALHRVANGGDIVAEELSAGVPRPATLDRDERDALTELELWIEDADIHVRDHDYARFKREWMRDRLAVLRDPRGSR
jgi:hypothetical protein